MIGIGSLLSLGAYLYLNLVQTHRVEMSGGADIPILFRLLLPFISLSSILLMGSDPWPLGLDPVLLVLDRPGS